MPNRSYVKFLDKRVNPKDPTEEPEEKEERDIPLEEADYSYYARPGRDFGFLHGLEERTEKSERKRKRKKQEDDENLERDYEAVPRVQKDDKQKMKHVLPIKTKEKGIVPRMIEVEEASEDEGSDEENKEEQMSEDEEPSEDMIPDPEDLPELSTAELFAQRQATLEAKKRQIALLASAIIENPQENIGKLKQLRVMLKDSEVFLTVRKLAMLSLLEVFKDIIPTYRIRIATEKEKAGRAKKETIALRHLEESLLENYQLYLEFLEAMTASQFGKDKKKKLKGKKKADVPIPTKAAQGLKEVALHCLCDLLATHPHFNFRTNIITVITPFMTSKNEKLSDITCNCAKRIFKEDKSGEVTLEMVRLIGRVIKTRKFSVTRKILDTFLSLRIKRIEGPEDQNNGNLDHGKKKFMSRREKKKKKQMQYLEHELEEAAATQNTRQKLRLHTEIISNVFLTYFRILKKAPQSSLLSSVLAGLAKHAHLINVNFFDDLFSVINQLVETENLSYQESLHCVKTAFVILSGQGSALNIDPMRFYTHLYKTLFHLNTGCSSDDIALALECLDLMISRRRRQVSHQRVLAFVKRACTLAPHLMPHATIAMLSCLRQFLSAYPRVDVLLDTENEGPGVYLPELTEPEHCNAHNTSLYELHLLRHHYHPTVQQFSRHLLAGAPSQGREALSQELARRSPQDLYNAYDCAQMGFNPAIQTKPTKATKKSKFSHDFMQEEFTTADKKLTAKGTTELDDVELLSSLDFVDFVKTSSPIDDTEGDVTDLSVPDVPWLNSGNVNGPKAENSSKKAKRAKLK